MDAGHNTTPKLIFNIKFDDSLFHPNLKAIAKRGILKVQTSLSGLAVSDRRSSER